jgi:hypothetical protein
VIRPGAAQARFPAGRDMLRAYYFAMACFVRKIFDRAAEKP